VATNIIDEFSAFIFGMRHGGSRLLWKSGNHLPD